ncbi:Sas10 C-terminal domain-containing protein [Aspergillus avenaceus]|uniref:Sas10 C-terminal domain-containing protein n=1 Tax=Aspergillus avenaceus TaxID=36643 RepID=A0A5N6TSL9_ASPAV|nr:Sas10 C-terminal domain-containing protein [Aspergillus avenaceus]
MGKRKASGRPAARNASAPERTKFNIEERFDDSEDDFQTGRDQILLEEEPNAKRRRRVAQEEEMLQPSDEEIMGYESVDEDDLDDEDLDDGDDQDDEEIDDEEILYGKKRGADASEDEDEEGIAAWGSSKKDLYNADQIETEADALEEEEEAKRLQQKHLQAMDEADFGFDESEWVESGKAQDDGEDDAGVVTEVLPQLEVTEDMSTEEKLKILKSRYPEFEPLAKDFLDLQATLRTLAEAAKAANGRKHADDSPETAPVPVIKHRALSAYLGTITMYFMLLTSSRDESGNPSPLSPAQLRSHPVMNTLVKFRKLWESVKDLPEPEESEIDSADEIMDDAIEVAQAPSAKKQTKKGKNAAVSKKKEKISKAERAAEAARAEAEARRTERLQETEANLADLSELVTKPGKKRVTKKAKSSTKDDNDSDFGDEDALTAKEAEEKAKQKRSLRFYTSQLAQKANKRTAAGRDAGGDADIPYRERLRDRQARLNAEAEKRGKQMPKGSEQLGGDSDDEDHRVANELRGGQSGSDDDDYYDMIASRSKQRKDEKKARAEVYAAAAREGGQVAVQEEVGPDGKRAISYQIEKNKGLAPKRNKDSRNPRVKKRKRFEDKKKKLGSIRQVYKGGEGRGGYGGELTGIKKNVVKSVKL